MRPGALVANGNDIGMAGKHQVRATGAKPGIEIFDIRRALLGRRHPVGDKTKRLQHGFKDRQRAAFGRGHGRAADQGGKIGDGIDSGHQESLLFRGAWFSRSLPDCHAVSPAFLPLEGGGSLPLLPSGEKVPEGRMRGRFGTEEALFRCFF
jgi:hypothetical protein